MSLFFLSPLIDNGDTSRENPDLRRSIHHFYSSPLWDRLQHVQRPVGLELSNPTESYPFSTLYWISFPTMAEHSLHAIFYMTFRSFRLFMVNAVVGDTFLRFELTTIVAIVLSLSHCLLPVSNFIISQRASWSTRLDSVSPTNVAALRSPSPNGRTRSHVWYTFREQDTVKKCFNLQNIVAHMSWLATLITQSSRIFIDDPRYNDKHFVMHSNYESSMRSLNQTC